MLTLAAWVPGLVQVVLYCIVLTLAECVSHLMANGTITGPEALLYYLILPDRYMVLYQYPCCYYYLVNIHRE
jgi:hypothetical protein